MQQSIQTAKRRKRISVLLKEEVSSIIDREVDFPLGMMVTITKASLSIDRRYAQVLITVLGGSKEEALAILDKNIYFIQKKLDKRLRMRPVPQIKFAIDIQEEKRENVEKSLAVLKTQS